MREISRLLKYKRTRILLEVLKNIAKGWVFDISAAKATAAELAALKIPISEFTLPIRVRPELGPENANRIGNMKIAASLIDTLVVRPGKIFSLQALIGEPSPAKGFKDGPVLLNGRLCSAPGGGLCQISTVLFNAALLANMEILEKYNHSVDVWGTARLVGLGRDAVYAFAVKDLKFRNVSAAPVLVRLEVDEAQWQVAVKFYSALPLTGEISVETQMPEAVRGKRGASDVAGKARSPIRYVETRRYIKAGAAVEMNYVKGEYYGVNPSLLREEN